MIIEFSVKNYRSIRELQTISFVSSGLKSAKNFSSIDSNNITEIENNKVFKTIGIYGANASGKSNILKAFFDFLEVVIYEPSSKSNLGNVNDPFLYQDNIDNKESFFQIVLLVDKEKYRYGFTIKKNPLPKPKDTSIPYSSIVISSEWLFGKKEKNQGVLFTRKDGLITNRLSTKNVIPPIPYKHSLYISHVAAFDNNNICQKIRNQLDTPLSNIHTELSFLRQFSIAHINDKSEKYKKGDLLQMLSYFGLRYDDVSIEKDPDQDVIYPQEQVSFYRKAEYADKQIILNLAKHESDGTQKLFDLVGALLISFNFEKSVLFIIDEIDDSFHPELLIKLIDLFNTPEINKSNSQLLFTSHDTNLMSPSIMRRDQFYFTEKNDDESTRLYSLADLKGIRNDADFAKQYLAGYYGALPVFKDGLYKKEQTNG